MLEPEGDFTWPQGPDSAFFALYEFRRTLGSFKTHFWAGERWESVRDHADPQVRAELDALLLGLAWAGCAPCLARRIRRRPRAFAIRCWTRCRTGGVVFCAAGF
ncbi:hypothetical protein [Streptomyces sp. wa13]|uniref:hypothetical protein n=1 Tax=Streptomyces sp. wa13 TaxID=1828236 RepID=UPI003C7A5803